MYINVIWAAFCYSLRIQYLQCALRMLQILSTRSEYRNAPL